MAMIKCPNCGQRIQDSSRKCKYCGYDDITSYILNIERKKDIARRQKELKEREIRDFTINHPVEYIQPQTQQQNIPKCPTCGSTNIRKMGGVERGASIAAFGIFSKKINKTFKCGNCGYTW